MKEEEDEVAVVSRLFFSSSMQLASEVTSPSSLILGFNFSSLFSYFKFHPFFTRRRRVQFAGEKAKTKKEEEKSVYSVDEEEEKRIVSARYRAHPCLISWERKKKVRQQKAVPE